MKSFDSPLSDIRRAQRGVTLIEALVALLVMSFGMVALVGLQANLRYSGDVAKQRSEAMRLAQEEIETLRAFSVISKPAGSPAKTKDYENDLLNAVDVRSLTGETSNTTFMIARTVTPLVQGVELAANEKEPQTIRAQTVRISVTWKDRSGKEQSLALDSIISRTDPVFSLAVGVTPPTNGIRTPDNRNPVIPAGSKDLGNGSSAFRPGVSSTTVWVFNNVTGVITGKCSIEVDTPVSTLTASSVDSCKNNTVGYLVSGVIRFSKLNTPNPAAPEADALPQPLAVYLNLTASQFKVKNSSGADVLAPGGEYPSPNQACFNDAPVTSTATQKLVNYYCVVFPNSQTPRNWWGQVLLSGLSLGSGASDYKVCRYSADYNGNGYVYTTSTVDPGFKIDNEEHPETYRGVSYSLTRQNFLVMPGKAEAICPTLLPDPSAGRFVDYSTYQIQP